MYELVCKGCDKIFPAKRPDKLYCSQPCASRVGRRRRGEQTDVTAGGSDCRWCGKRFEITPPATNRRYCSEDCGREAARKIRREWMRRNPLKQKEYNGHRPFRDSVLGRLRRRYPDIPTACESCGESRILEIAHKPQHKRNGAWKVVSNTKRHMIWILCPTCHKLLDRGICSTEELGLN